MLSTPFELQIVFTPKRMHRTESTTLVLSLQKFPRTAVIQEHNRQPKPFIWTAKANDILEKVKRAKANLNNGLSV